MNIRQNQGRCRESKRIYSLVHLFLFVGYREVKTNKGLLQKEGNEGLKIASSFIGMESARTLQSSQTRRLSYQVSLGGGMTGATTEEELGTEENLQNTKERGGEKLNDAQAKLSGSGNLFRLHQANTEADFGEALKEIRQQTIVYLWKLLFGERAGKDLAERLGLKNGLSSSDLSPNRIEARPIQTLQITAREEIFYSESESTSFSAVGMVRTADGRELSFQVDVGMSRSFSQYISRERRTTAMCDPLVINLNGNIAEVSDQKFFFDLDADGEEEAISRLCEDSGYLALDLNGDGKINNGSELFGTKSGDGFADLAKYDEDGNGWIDENDSIWDKLKIWIQQKDGTSRLYRLEEKGVGAICLQNAATDFTHKNSQGEINGAIRSTGIFLYENGLAGTLQHLDLAVGHLEQLA